MQYTAILWDLDGTLMDTMADLTASVNTALSENGLPTRTAAEVTAMTGHGIRDLIEHAVPAGCEPDRLERVFARFKEHYALHCRDNTRPYDGVVALLRRWKAAGGLSAIVSNKAAFAVEQLAAEEFPGLTDAVFGQTEQLRKKPAPDMPLAAVTALGASPDQVLYVGDSEVDVETARAAGLAGLFVTWGFRTRQQLIEAGAGVIVDTPEELAAYLNI